MTIRSARPEDADFIAQTILSSQRGYRPRGWFDVALGWPETQCREFIARVAAARAVSMWHVSQFLVAEIDGKPAAALCALPTGGRHGTSGLACGRGSRSRVRTRRG